jgi:hypothetical protein
MKIILLFTLICYSSLANAAIYQCKTSWGRSTFQSKACAKSMKQKIIQGQAKKKRYKKKKKAKKIIKSINGINTFSAAQIYGEYVCLAKFKGAEQAKKSLNLKFGQSYERFPSTLTKITTIFNGNDDLVKKHEKEIKKVFRQCASKARRLNVNVISTAYNLCNQM